ncbi:PREDICTED: coiled-coil domain-containing protein 175 [Elephantulus edwardii]|uniref:coiled-coil domain-containing protein 175 n=1 Tax=Elephantulus edwardii TaxID=28737 RepID=UPI0003F05F8D|nr:PREDICTED: coiled-coil domain-containing protein 175 [Elephantulus edwardii]
MSLSPCSSDPNVSGKKVLTVTEQAKAEKGQEIGVSTGPSLELCVVPATLGSSVAAAALEQLLFVEQSLQSDYFKCDEAARIFLQDIAVAVKKLEQMRKATIDLLEIETMELSRLYFLLETLPKCFNREMEECVRDARKSNIFEINKLYQNIASTDSEIESLKKTLIELDETNKILGEKQERLVKQHKKFVLSLNHAMSEKADTTIYINETYSKINLKKEEIRMHKQCIEEIEEKMEKDREEHALQKKTLNTQIDELTHISENKKNNTYKKKKELDKLTVKMSKIKQTIISTSVVLSDHNLEIEERNGDIKDWEIKVKDLEKIQQTLENKINFFSTHKEKLNEISTSQKEEFLNKIKEVAEKLHYARSENKDLREKLTTLAKQYKNILHEEEEVFLKRRNMFNEYQKQQKFIAQKELYLAQRKLDIKNMKEGLKTLEELHKEKQEIYRKQIEIMGDNREREKQRSVIYQWNIAHLLKKHKRWADVITAEIKNLLQQIEATQQRKTSLSEETDSREKEIDLFVAQIEQLTVELKEEEKKFVCKEKQLIADINKYEVKLVKEVQVNKEREEELAECLPQLQEAEEIFAEKYRQFEDLTSALSAQKREETLISHSIFQTKRDLSRYTQHMDKTKEDRNYFRKQESFKTQEHFEILKNLENEIYVNDQKTEFLLVENERLKRYLVFLSNNTIQS